MAKKISKAVASYKNYSGRQQCRYCSMFRQPNRCTLVTGHINSHGTCKHWEPKDASETQR